MKAIFLKEFRWRRPGKNVAFWIKPSEQPQSFPRDVTEAAIEAGAAEAVPPKRKAAEPEAASPED